MTEISFEVNGQVLTVTLDPNEQVAKDAAALARTLVSAALGNEPTFSNLVISEAL